MINDKYISLLNQIKESINENIREFDINFKWDESSFMMMLPETDLDGAINVAYKLEERLNKINTDFLSSKMSEEEVLKTIKKVHEKFDIVLDPHSAIGYGAFDKVNLSGNNIVLATAHPCKFPDAIKNAINLKAELPKELMYILSEKENFDIIDNNIDKVKQHIKERI